MLSIQVKFDRDSGANDPALAHPALSVSFILLAASNLPNVDIVAHHHVSLILCLAIEAPVAHMTPIDSEIWSRKNT